MNLYSPVREGLKLSLSVISSCKPKCKCGWYIYMVVLGYKVTTDMARNQIRLDSFKY